MKNIIVFVLLSVLLVLLSCSKEESANQANQGNKLVMSSEYNPDFYPEGDVQELMTNFFNEAIEYQNDSSFICVDYGLSEGGWYLTAGLNYLCADAMAQIDSLEEYTFNGTIEITGDTILELDGNSLIQCMLNMRTSINELNADGKQVGAVQCIFNGIEGDDALFSFKAIYGNTTNYDDVTLLNPLLEYINTQP